MKRKEIRFFRRASDGEGQVFPPPYGEVPFFPVVRGPVPRERWIAGARTMARDRPSPYDEGAFCLRGPGRRAALLHRDREVSPTKRVRYSGGINTEMEL